MVQHIKINQCNAADSWNKRRKPHNHLNSSRKKNLTKIQHLFTMQTLSKPKIEGNFLKRTPGILGKPTADVTLSGKGPKRPSLRSGAKQDVPFPTSVHRGAGGPTQGSWARKERKGAQAGKEVKPSLFAGDIISPIEFPSELIATHKKRIRTNIWIQKSCSI